MPQMPKRTVRIPAPLWDAAMIIGAQSGMSKSQVVREALAHWVQSRMGVH